MNKHPLLLLLLIALIFAITTTIAIAKQKDAAKKEKVAGAPAIADEEKATMEAWIKYAAPGEEHKRLEYFVGEWDYISKYWPKPDAIPILTNGTATQTMIYEGRYMQTIQKGSYMGQPFEGFGLLGYDNYNKVHILFWIDSMSTGFWEIKGTYDAANKVYNFKGVWDDPINKTKQKVKLLYKIIDDNKFIYETYMIDAKGGEFKNMEITYNRKAK